MKKPNKKKEIKPFIAYLAKCGIQKWTDSGLFLTLKETQRGSCKDCEVLKVKIIPYKKL